MSTMLRPIIRSSRNASRVQSASLKETSILNNTRATFGTQSGNDAHKPTALATLYLEDGTVLTGRSFGHHSSVEGEVRNLKLKQKLKYRKMDLFFHLKVSYKKIFITFSILSII